MLDFKPLPPGSYIARCKESSKLQAVLNGHGSVWPEAMAVSDGLWVWFTKGTESVFACNATYAHAHFEFTDTGGNAG